MTAVEPRIVLDRLRAITWDDDFGVSLSHARSRALLMREYLRRAALWAEEYHAEGAWPFFDITEYIQPPVPLEPDVSAELDEYIRLQVGTPSIERICRGAVRFSAVTESGAELPDLPDMYAPLLVMFERGGAYSVEQFIDLRGVAIPQGTLEKNLAAVPFLTLTESTLNALDGQGRITYYAKISKNHPRENPQGVVRRRLVGSESESHDEEFTHDSLWQPTEYLRLHEQAKREFDCVRITEAEAAEFIQSATEKVTRK